jgi:hypothetical protein
MGLERRCTIDVDQAATGSAADQPVSSQREQTDEHQSADGGLICAAQPRLPGERLFFAALHHKTRQLIMEQTHGET